MRGLGTLVCVLAVVAILASSVAAISNGPGGRMYFAGRADVTETTDCNILIRSVVINPDWTIGTFETHGTVTNYRDDWTGGVTGVPYDGHFAPQIETNGGTGYSSLVMGLWYNNDPASTVSGVSPVSTGQTMDVLRIATSAGSQSVSVLGNGRAANAAGSTDMGSLVLTDPGKGLVGATGGYIVTGYQANANFWYSYAAVHDATGSGDLTVADADYKLLTGNSWAKGLCGGALARYYDPAGARDQYVLGNKIFYSQQNYGIGMWSAETGPVTWDNPGWSAGDWSDLAVTSLNGHDAVYWINKAYGTLRLGVDLNNDNQCTGAEQINLGSLSSFGVGLGSYSDLEFIQGNDGKKFLLGYSADQQNLIVIQLFDNGLGVQGSTTVSLGTNLNNGTYNLTSMEFAQTFPVPEPVTLTLLGAGAFGVGWFRRKRTS